MRQQNRSSAIEMIYFFFFHLFVFLYYSMGFGGLDFTVTADIPMFHKDYTVV